MVIARSAKRDAAIFTKHETPLFLQRLPRRAFALLAMTLYSFRYNSNDRQQHRLPTPKGQLISPQV
jgi:hypothetical protein